MNMKTELLDTIGWWVAAVIVFGLMIAGIVFTCLDIALGSAISVVCSILLLTILVYVGAIDLALMLLRLNEHFHQKDNK